MIRPFSRRRFLAIAAAGAVMPGRLPAATAFWRGRALGAEATVTLGGLGHATAAATIAALSAELERLEQVFSLYRDTSALSRLNRDGYLDLPPADLITVLRHCDALNTATGGAFDPTVQALWQVMAGASCASARDLGKARALVGWSGVEVEPDRIGYARPGMAITLNGIAQGFITDRVAQLLRAHGFDNVLIDMGEVAALGRNHGAPWTADIATPDGRRVDRVTLTDRCLAVSAPDGTQLCGGDHILDPRATGVSKPRELAAVSAESAVIADGLSTACCLLGDTEAASAVARFAGASLDALI